jgi:hypothetical protein
MRLTDITLNCNNNMSAASLLSDIEKAYDTTWNLGLLCKLSKLKISISLIKITSPFLSQREFRVSVEGEMSTRQGCHKFTSCVYLSIYLSMCLFVYLVIYLSLCLSIYLCLYVCYLSISLSVFISLSVCLSVNLFIYLSVCLSVICIL